MPWLWPKHKEQGRVARQETQEGEHDPEHEEVLSVFGGFCFVRVWTLSCRFSNGISWSTKVTQRGLFGAIQVAAGGERRGRSKEDTE